MQVNPVESSVKKTTEEEHLIIAARKNASHFAPLYERYHEPIFRFVYQRLNDKSDAFDITQQVFLKALSNISNYENRGLPFSSWLYRIATNEMNSFFKKNSSKRTVNIETPCLNIIMEDMQYNYERDAMELLLMDVIAGLPDEELLLIEMRFFEKRPFKEIAEILNLTENNAKVKTYRLLEKMKTLLTKK